MAKTTSEYQKKVQKQRPDVHAKTKHSNHKSSKNYRKLYRGQGR